MATAYNGFADGAEAGVTLKDGTLEFTSDEADSYGGAITVAVEAKKPVVVKTDGDLIGGVLDVSEFGSPGSCYLDQNTDLQEEVAAKIAAFYDCGFEYAYFDGSEGVNAPFNFHVSNAQYRQWKAFGKKPLFCEGAAKTHFDWHILSGANAFDCFEVMRRWETARELKLLTREQKLMLRDTRRRFRLDERLKLHEVRESSDRSAI